MQSPDKEAEIKAVQLDFAAAFWAYLQENPEQKLGTVKELEEVYQQWLKGPGCPRKIVRGAGFSGVLFHLSRVMNVCEVSRNTNIAWGSPASKKKQQASPSRGGGGGRKSPTSKQSPTASPKAKSLSKGDIKAAKAKPVASPSPERPASPVVAPTNAWIKPKEGKAVANAWESSNTVREKLIAPSSPTNLEARNAHSSGEGGGGGASAPATPKEVFSSLEHSPAMGSPPGATRSRSLFQEESGAVSPATASMHTLGGGSKGKRRTEICSILELADLPLTYDDVFRDYGVDSKADILALSEEDWALLEFKPFHRKKLQDFLQSAK